MKTTRGRSCKIFHASLIAFFIFTFLFFIECCLADESSVPPPLRLADLISEVLKCNPNLASARSSTQAAFRRTG